jgi:hypothetical protein
MALGERKKEEKKLSQCHVIHHKSHMEFFFFWRRNAELHGERPATRYPSDGREQSGIPTVSKWLSIQNLPKLFNKTVVI